MQKIKLKTNEASKSNTEQKELEGRRKEVEGRGKEMEDRGNSEGLGVEHTYQYNTVHCTAIQCNTIQLHCLSCLYDRIGYLSSTNQWATNDVTDTL